MIRLRLVSDEDLEHLQYPRWRSLQQQSTAIDSKNPNKNPTEVSDHNCLKQTIEELAENTTQEITVMKYIKKQK